MNYLAIAVGGALGALCRYGAGRGIQGATEGQFPLGTLVVNLVGCLVMGIAFQKVEDGQFVSEAGRLFVLTGLLGAFTTYSTFSLEAFNLLKESLFAQAAVYLGAHLFVGLAAIWGGIQLGRIV
ncbi:MAG: fluoride efflux transporter CrcB [Planctomycetota bacterium]|jgi:CrcB protein|nr:fluoride efflux transporter CrcB [Planctomycetota bacterium]MDP7253610.1 fluoride efflux transporter CrcB [Planctomycetota bacterium]